MRCPRLKHITSISRHSCSMADQRPYLYWGINAYSSMRSYTVWEYWFVFIKTVSSQITHLLVRKHLNKQHHTIDKEACIPPLTPHWISVSKTSILHEYCMLVVLRVVKGVNKNLNLCLYKLHFYIDTYKYCLICFFEHINISLKRLCWCQLKDFS